MAIDEVRDAAFLKKLDIENVKTHYVKILLYKHKEFEQPKSIEGVISAGSLSIDGKSAIRRSGTLTFLVNEDSGVDLLHIDNELTMHAKIKILIGFENTIDDNYDKIIWFNQGIFIITQPTFTHNPTSVTVTLQIKDKMCMLNGECGGTLPASVDFSSYDQIWGYREIDCGDSEEPIYPVDVNDYTIYGFKVLDTTPPDTNPMEQTGIASVYQKSLNQYVRGDNYFTSFEDNITDFTTFISAEDKKYTIIYMSWSEEGGWTIARKSDIGERTSRPQKVFDIIQTMVCNYGPDKEENTISKIIINNVPKDIKTIRRYIGTSSLYHNIGNGQYSFDKPIDMSLWREFKTGDYCGYGYTDFTYPGSLISSFGDTVTSILDKIISSVLTNYEYYYDLDGNFIFQEIKNYLNTSYDLLNENDTLTINGYIIGKENFYVDYSSYAQSSYYFNEGNSLITNCSNTPNYNNIRNDYHVWGKDKDKNVLHYHLVIKEKPVIDTEQVRKVIFLEDGKVKLATPYDKKETIHEIYVKDWREELYYRGLEKVAKGQRPDLYEQEILDLFDSIYNMAEQKFKADIVNNINELRYWIDYLEPVGYFQDISVEAIGTRIYTHQQDNINRLYTTDIPNFIMLDIEESAYYRQNAIRKCEEKSQQFSNVTHQIYNSTAMGETGYAASEVARDLLYQYTDFMSAINITSIPIYYLNTNTRIRVEDKKANIFGDYVIKTINLPLDPKGTMSINATRALSRI